MSVIKLNWCNHCKFLWNCVRALESSHCWDVGWQPSPSGVTCHEDNRELGLLWNRKLWTQQSVSLSDSTLNKIPVNIIFKPSPYIFDTVVWDNHTDKDHDDGCRQCRHWLYFKVYLLQEISSQHNDRDWRSRNLLISSALTVTELSLFLPVCRNLSPCESPVRAGPLN